MQVIRHLSDSYIVIDDFTDNGIQCPAPCKLGQDVDVLLPDMIPIIGMRLESIMDTQHRKCIRWKAVMQCCYFRHDTKLVQVSDVFWIQILKNYGRQETGDLMQFKDPQEIQVFLAIRPGTTLGTRKHQVMEVSLVPAVVAPAVHFPDHHAIDHYLNQGVTPDLALAAFKIS